METQIKKIDSESLKLSKEILLSGGLVAFPTETVYGLGADARNTEAVESIYTVKGRPQDNPLICHVHKDYPIYDLVEKSEDYVDKLIEKFLPGALTLIFKSKNKVSKVVSCGLDSLAIRMPSNADAQRFLKECNIPIAAPSANISSHVSPVTAEHVYKDFNGKIPLILDGGKCSGGIESTVLDVRTSEPILLRPGLVTYEMLLEICPNLKRKKIVQGEQVVSPGMKYKHYAPKCETVLLERDEIDKANAIYNSYIKAGKTPYIMCENEFVKYFENKNLLLLGSAEEDIASNLYDKLREGEEKADVIISFKLIDKGVLSSVKNRMDKAFYKV